MTRLRTSLALLLLLGCGTLGTETDFPGAITTSGVGPFRQLERYETGIPRAPAGQAVDAHALFVDSGAAAGGQLFYAAADILADPPERDATLPSYAIDWAQADGRGIYRAASGGFSGTLAGESVSLPGFAPGERVLSAEQSWEGGEVFDPCPVMLADGRLRLYYAAAFGIGVAEASAPDAALTRVGDGPILAPDASTGAGGTPRSPAVVDLGSEGVLLYYDVGDGVRVARSDDGLSFTPVDTDPSTPAIDPIYTTTPEPGPDAPTEGIPSMPGATAAITPTGRRVIRLYFEVPEDDGTRIVSVSASSDGVLFERYGAASFKGDDPGAPRPWLHDDGATLLVSHITRQQGGLEAGALVLAITPANRHLADEP